jgi:SAM-dependent methyltransferase
MELSLPSRRIRVPLLVAVGWILQGSITAADRPGWGATIQPACLATPRRGRRKAPSKQKGFGETAAAEVVEENSPLLVDSENKPNADVQSSAALRAGKQIYSLPGLYDLAFGYRNYEEEVDFLIGQHQRLHDGKPPARTLELAAGPARHTIAALQSDHQVRAGIALDTSPEMVDYGIETAQMELDIDSFESFTYLKGDMTEFELSDNDSPVDSAWILLGSLQHLTDNEQVISCFQSIHKAMRQNGTLIIELPHPRETFSLVECTRNGWEVPLEDENGEESGELEIIWGDDNDDFDPIRQVRQFTVAMELKGAGSETISPDFQSVREIVPMRLFTAQEIDVLARISGFRVESMHGALCEGVDVNDGVEAFRLVCVLQKN